MSKNAAGQNQIEKVELIINTTPITSDSTVFRISGKRRGNLFGILSVSSLVETKVGAQTGNLLEIKQPLWSLLFFSFIR